MQCLYLAAIGASLPSRGAWIEILPAWLIIALSDRRSPRGERGLKYKTLTNYLDKQLSLPSRGAWIEINIDFRRGHLHASRSPRGERGLK